jgi:exodeoxyribonuclease V alpha subunit
MTAASTPAQAAEVTADPPERHEAGVARRAVGLLQEFNLAGVVNAADVHVATRVGRLGGVEDEAVLLATALAVRAPRLGHVCVDLATIRSTADSDLDDPVDLQQLRWPSVADWQERLTASPLVGPDRPMRLEGDTLYLDRYWSLETQVAADLRERAASWPDDVDEAALTDLLDVLFPAAAEAADSPVVGPAGVAVAPRALQRLAAAAAVSSRLCVVAGGPGTGKTTTVARVLALLDELAERAGRRPPLVALTAPTGKAAARLQEAVHEAARDLPVPPATRERLLALRGTTAHRLLGRRPDSQSRFRHDRLNRLAHDVVVVDETSMVALSMMARLVEAVRPDARLVLVGDPEQLASVEAGAVLGDIVGPAVRGLRMREGARRTLARRAGQDVPAAASPPTIAIGDGIVVLEHVHRYGGGIAPLAAAIRAGDADGALGLLAAGDGDLRWIRWDAGDAGATTLAGASALAPLREAAVEAGRVVVEAARKGLAEQALAALGTFRVLCAHRRGAAGAAMWGHIVEQWLAAEVPGLGGEGPWYAGRPLLVTANDYSLRLFNGDTGVVVAAGAERVAAAFERAGEVVLISPTRLAAVDSVHAMTVHKSQGSQFLSVAVVLPPAGSPVLTRELLYTAVTRARRSVLIAGTEDALRTAIERPIARSSGLAARLWGSTAGDAG